MTDYLNVCTNNIVQFCFKIYNATHVIDIDDPDHLFCLDLCDEYHLYYENFSVHGDQNQLVIIPNSRLPQVWNYVGDEWRYKCQRTKTLQGVINQWL